MAYLDAWEEELTDFVKKYYQDFFNKNGFVFLRKDSGCFIYSDSAVLLKIENKQKKYIVQIGQASDSVFWDWELFISNFKFMDYKISESDVGNRKNVLLKSVNRDDYSGNVNILSRNLKRIKTDLASDKYKKTKEQLVNLELERIRFQ